MVGLIKFFIRKDFDISNRNPGRNENPINIYKRNRKHFLCGHRPGVIKPR
jgi:hypothetical protein